MNLSDTQVLVTGAHGFLGKRLCNMLRERGVAGLKTPSHADCDFMSPDDCARAVDGVDLVIHLAAKVGGIGLHQRCPGEMFYDNLLMGVQLMESARQSGVRKFVNVGTVCSYPKETPVPFEESWFWKGFPDPSNAPFGVAKKTLQVMGAAYRAQYGFDAVYVVPASAYGPGDDFEPATSHVVPALIKRVYDAKVTAQPEIVCWGDGSATREFVFIDDMVRGILLAAEQLDSSEPVNLGRSEEVSIKTLVTHITSLMGYTGQVKWDISKPAGQKRRALDSSRASNLLGFRPEVSLRDGLQCTIDWYREHPLPVGTEA